MDLFVNEILKYGHFDKIPENFVCVKFRNVDLCVHKIAIGEYKGGGGLVPLRMPYGVISSL